MGIESSAVDLAPTECYLHLVISPNSSCFVIQARMGKEEEGSLGVGVG